MITASEALARLREGNRRFTEDALSTDRLANTTRRRAVRDSQSPFAVILGCSDSRVPAEMIFDQGLGDLFVIRVAGNIVAPSQIGSVEFAAERFGLSLVVVLGHSNCGAIIATVEELSRRSKEQSPNLRHIVDRIRPAVQAYQGTDIEKDRNQLVHHSVRQNVRMSANQLRHGSDILEHLIERKGLVVVGAEYSLETGEVDFFDGVPEGV